MIRINQQAPDFTEDAYIDDSSQKISLSKYKGKWVVLYFYPKDFTFVCPTELGDLADRYEDFKKANCEIISVSTDTVEVHKAWHTASDTIKKITFPMVADPAHRVSNAYGTLIEEEGVSTRASILINPDGIIKAFEYHDNSVGRSGEELLRKLQAAIFSHENGGEVCPVNWKPGGKTLKPGLDLVGKI